VSTVRIKYYYEENDKCREDGDTRTDKLKKRPSKRDKEWGSRGNTKGGQSSIVHC